MRLSVLVAGCYLLGLGQLQAEQKEYAFAQDQSPARQFREFAARQDETGLFPNIFNLATNAIISTNATCGQSGQEHYCKLVEHVFMRQPQCDVCDDSRSDKRHDIEKAIDGSNQWWQSPTLSGGLQYEWITIRIDLRQEYQVAYVIVKSAIAPRPGRWVLEKSLDNVTFTAWQYFATSESECQREFGLPASNAHQKFDRDDEVICTALFSKLDPLQNGEIHVSLVNGRPGVVTRSPELQSFTRARYIRLRFQSIRTLNADLMVITRHHHNHDLIDQSVTRRYFYAIKDISIGGQCICYGHAERCPTDPITGQLQCECAHNTCGSSCSTCCPMFNQKLWQPGTIETPNYCEQCQCYDHAESCEYDEQVEADRSSITPEGIFEGGGRCVDCKHNTAGTNCQMCSDGFYRAQGVSHYRADACQPCMCHVEGSLDANCVKDETQPELADGLMPGDCKCKTGFGGRQCDRCALGFRKYPTCEPCPCNRHGSANFATCEEPCQCKANVQGLYCDECKAGFINLDENNALGCQQCFCFGVTDKCTEFDWARSKIRTLEDWKLTDIDGYRDSQVTSKSDGALSLDGALVQDGSLVYWKAPQAFTGNLLNSYTGLLQYFVYFVSDRASQPSPFPDIILEGNDIRLEYHSRRQFLERENTTVQVRLTEMGNNWYNANTRQPVTKREFMRALANVRLLLIRANYVAQQRQSSIYAVSLDKAIEYPDATDLMRGIEQCECPELMTGFSCESCIPGYRRVNNELFGGQCEKCECNGHSTECDPYTAACIDCADKTTGSSCERCLPAHYGNPALGGEEGACKPCACPLTNPENNFSPECRLAEYSTIAGTADYVCTACQPGYVGQKCESCDDGYWGDPTAVNGTCEPCECNGNVDVMSVGYCDRQTGNCLRCTNYTTGDHCEMCKPDHYGDALMHTCKPCDCHRIGSNETQCDPITGKCSCRDNYRSQQCNQCVEGHGDIENGCPECACNMTGSVDDLCNPASGQCYCKTGVFGKHCDRCKNGYYDFNAQGCTFCGCDEYGSLQDAACDSESGQCQCQPHVQSQMCNECEEGYFNITSRQGCQLCDCNELGSVAQTCDMISGQCQCKYNVEGEKCDKCMPNTWGLSDEGCKKCQQCPAPGHVCNAVTGDCDCPKNTMGDMCEQCTNSTYWNYDAYDGCEECLCEKQGSRGQDCDLGTGQCHCKSAYTGRTCESCMYGHYEYPTCKKCNCNVGGTSKDRCAKELCDCDDDGKCPCKANVEGDKCQKCKADSFSLHDDNPNGCTKCFCFERTGFCVQSNFVWQQVYVDNYVTFFDQMRPSLRFERQLGYPLLQRGINNYNSQPPTQMNTVYWPMPTKLMGDRINSYNGNLRFTIHNWHQHSIGPVAFDDRLWTRFPLVVLTGNDRIILEYYPRQPIPENGKLKVSLREDHWILKTAPELSVSRKMFMVALQNVQSVFIRATFIERPTQAEISEISLDVATYDNTTDTNTNNTAIGVELCADCPQGYAGTSCQNPAEGYCRKRVANYLNQDDDLALIGAANACACNSHSTTCDPETCICTECQHNTTGEFCEICEPGYFGDAMAGGEGACKKCACPREDNSFSETCHVSTYGKGYVCSACQYGYEGQYCENCLEGFYGDPTQAGGKCLPCACHSRGAQTHLCDRNTGQCVCHPGLTGRDCSQCQPRHALKDGICQSCDQGCTNDLMLAVDELESIYASYNYTGLVPVPWKRLRQVENNTLQLAQQLKDIKDSQQQSEQLTDQLNAKNSYSEEANSIIYQAENDLLKKVAESVENLTASLSGTEDTQQVLNDMYEKTYEIITALTRFTSGAGGSGTHSVDRDALLTQAKEYLRAIRERDEYIKQRQNYAKVELRNAKELQDDLRNRKLNETTFEQLFDRLDAAQEALEGARGLLWDDARPVALAANNITRISRKRIAEFQRILTEIGEKSAHADDNMANSTNVIANAKGEILDTFNDFDAINKTDLVDITQQTEKCLGTANQFTDLISDYRGELVLPAMEHADQLEYQANRLRDSFTQTQDISDTAVRAAGAFDQIVDALHNSTKAADRANEAAINTYDEIYPVDTESLMIEADRTQNESRQMKTDASDLGVKSLESQRESYEKRLGDVSDSVIEGTKQLDALRTNYPEIDARHTTMDAAVNAAENAETAAEQIDKAVAQLAKQVADLADAADTHEHFTGTGVRLLTDSISQAVSEIANATKQMNDVMARAQQNRHKVGVLGENLALLKDKIKEAREKAAKIPIAVGSTGECVRSYMSPAHPTPVNTISVKYRPLHLVPDSLVLLSRTQRRRTQPSEHLALEMKDQNFIFHWNIGEESRRITNTKRVAELAAKDQGTWYKIDIERRGNGASLTVSLINQAKEDAVANVIGQAETVQLTHSDQAHIFNTDPGTTQISLGADPDDLPEGITTSALRGTIGSLRVDDRDISLWAFSASSGQCLGAISPVSPPGSGHMFRNGYAQMQAGGQYHEQNFQIRILFAAYSPDGLIYFRGDEENEDFVAVYLLEGHVVLEFYLGGESTLKLQSNQPYNNGVMTTVTASRQKKTGTLRVGADDEVTGEAPGDNLGLNVAKQSHMIGGVPRSFNRSRWTNYNIPWDGFFGCMFDVRPDAQGQPLNLAQAERSINVEEGCLRDDKKRLQSTQRMISFEPTPEKSAFMVVRGVTLDEDQSTLSFSMRTRQQNATLLYQSRRVTTYRRRARELEQGKGFISVYLYSGVLIAHIGFTKEMATLRSNTICGNGRLHTVLLRRDGVKISLMIDDKIEATDTLSDQSAIGAEGAQLFLGGFPAGVEPVASEMPESSSLHGCIHDLFVMYRRVPMIPEKIENSLLGSCRMDGMAQPETALADQGSAALQSDNTIVAPSHSKTNRLEIEQRDPTVEWRRAGMSTVPGGTDVQMTTSMMPPTKHSSVCASWPLKSVSADTSVRFGLTEASHSRIAFKQPYPSTENLTLSFTFKTQQSTGLLITWANYKRFTQYLNLTLVNGRLLLVMKGHRAPQSLIFGADKPTLNDDQWHQVTLTKRGRQVTLAADDDVMESKLMPGKMGVTRRRLLVGGIYSRLRKQLNLTTPNFEGCMRDLAINGMSRALMKTHRDLIECKKASDWTLVAPEGYMTFDPIEPSDGNSLSVTVSVRSTEANGTLLAWASTKNFNKAHALLSYENNELKSTFMTEGSRMLGGLAIPFDGLCDGLPHTIKLHMQQDTQTVTISLDKQTPVNERMAGLAKLMQQLKKLPVHNFMERLVNSIISETHRILIG